MNKIIAIIPARGGSTRLTKKNIFPVLGKPMVSYTIDACKNSRHDIEIWVSSDCQEILEKVNEIDSNINTHVRSKETSSNSAYKQTAIREVANFIDKKNKIDSNYIILSLQANSPTIKSKDIDNCIDALLEFNRDEVFSVDNNLMQDAAIRVFKGRYVFQKDLSTNCGVVVTNLFDVHTLEDVKNVELILLNNSVQK